METSAIAANINAKSESPANQQRQLNNSFEKRLKGAFSARTPIEQAVEPAQLANYKNQLTDCYRLAVDENRTAIERVTNSENEDEDGDSDNSDSSSANNQLSDNELEHRTSSIEHNIAPQEPACCQDHHEQFVQGCQGLITSSKCVSAAQQLDAPKRLVPQAGDMTTPLIIAAQEGRLGACSEIAQKPGVDINAKGAEDNTALHFACQHNHATVVRLLLDLGADTNARNTHGNDALMEAAAFGHVECVQLLLQHGVQAHTTSGGEYKDSAFTLAAYKNHVDVVKLMLAKDTRADDRRIEDMHNALMEAAMDGRVEMAKCLVEAGAPLNFSNEAYESPLTLAATGGHLEMVKYLLEVGASVEAGNDEGYTPLMEAAREGHTEVCTLLIEKGADVNACTDETHETPLIMAAQNGHTDTVDVLLSLGAEIELSGAQAPSNYTGGTTALMEAAREGHLDTVKLLLEQYCAQKLSVDYECLSGYGCDGTRTNSVVSSDEEDNSAPIDELNTGEMSGDTALNAAAERGNVEIVELLCRAGARTDHEGADGRTPIMRAARNGHLDCVKMLHAFDPHCINKTNQARDAVPLLLAAQQNHMDVVQELLARGAAPALRLKDGTNAIMEAARHGHALILKLLMAWQYPDGMTIQLQPREKTAILEPDPALLSNWRTNNPNLDAALCDKPAAPPMNARSAPTTPLPTNDLLPPPPQHTKTTSTVTTLPPTAIAAATQSLNFTLQNMPMPPDALQALQVFQQILTSDEGKALAYLEENAKKWPNNHRDKMRAAVKKVADAFAANNSNAARVPITGTTGTVASSNIGVSSSCPADQVSNEVWDKKLRELKLDAGAQQALHTQTQKLISQQTSPAKTTSVTASVNWVDKLPKTPGISAQLQLNQAAVERKRKANIPLPKITSNVSCSSGNVRPITESDYESGDDEEAHETGGRKTVWTQVDTDQLSAATGNLKIESSTTTTKQQHMTSKANSKGKKAPAPPPSKCEAATAPKIDVNAFTESNQETALSLAAQHGRDEVVELLCKNGANIEHKDRKGFTPLIMAATGGWVNCVNILIANGAKLEAVSERTKDTALSLASSSGKKDVAAALVQAGANLEHRNISDYTPLSLAASGGFKDIVQLLLDRGADINSRHNSKLGITPLMLSAMNGHIEATGLLLMRGADIQAQIETNRNTALTLACFQGQAECVKLLIKYGAAVEHRAKTGLTPLMEAASGGYTDVGDALIQAGADVNAAPVSSSRDTALTIASDKGHEKFVDLLLKCGASIDVKNKKGCTPLWLSCNGGHLSTAQKLIAAGAEVDSADNRKITPLMAAFRRGYTKLVDYLVDRVNQFPSDGECQRFLAALSTKIKQAEEAAEKEANKKVDGRSTTTVPNRSPAKTTTVGGNYRSALTAGGGGHHCSSKHCQHNHDNQAPNLAAAPQPPQESAASLKEQYELCEKCSLVIARAKARQAAEAEKVADMLLKELQHEADLEESRKAAKERKKEKRKQKKLAKQKEDEKKEEKDEEARKVEQAETTPDTALVPVAPAPTAQAEVLSDESDGEDDSSTTPPRITVVPVKTSPPLKEAVIQRAAKKETPSKRQATSGRRPPSKLEVTPIKSNIEADWETQKATVRGRLARRANAANPVVDATTTIVPAGDLTVTLVGGRRLQQKLYVGAGYVARIIGRSGGNINAIREATRTQIEIEKQIPAHNKDLRTIAIRGHQTDDLRVAAKMIQALVDDADALIEDVVKKVLSLHEGRNKSANRTPTATTATTPTSSASAAAVAATTPTRPITIVKTPVSAPKSTSPATNIWVQRAQRFNQEQKTPVLRPCITPSADIAPPVVQPAPGLLSTPRTVDQSKAPGYKRPSSTNQQQVGAVSVQHPSQQQSPPMDNKSPSPCAPILDEASTGQEQPPPVESMGEALLSGIELPQSNATEGASGDAFNDLWNADNKNDAQVIDQLAQWLSALNRQVPEQMTSSSNKSQSSSWNQSDIERQFGALGMRQPEPMPFDWKQPQQHQFYPSATAPQNDIWSNYCETQPKSNAYQDLSYDEFCRQKASPTFETTYVAYQNNQQSYVNPMTSQWSPAAGQQPSAGGSSLQDYYQSLRFNQPPSTSTSMNLNAAAFQPTIASNWMSPNLPPTSSHSPWPTGNNPAW